MINNNEWEWKKIPPGHTSIGSCSCCGGPVTVPSLWMGVVPPVPTCCRCGATPKSVPGPVIETERPRILYHHSIDTKTFLID